MDFIFESSEIARELAVVSVSQFVNKNYFNGAAKSFKTCFVMNEETTPHTENSVVEMMAVCERNLLYEETLEHCTTSATKLT